MNSTGKRIKQLLSKIQDWLDQTERKVSYVWWRNRHWEPFLVLLLALGFGALVCSIAFVCTWPVSRDQPLEFLKAVGSLLTGTFVGLGLFFTARSLSHTRETQLRERLADASQQLGSTDERGNPRMEVRLGAIHALLSIAQDYEPYYWTIIEILTAYVRLNAFRKTEEREALPDPPEGRGGLSADIEAILYGLKNRQGRFELMEPLPLNLAWTDLRRGDLEGANLDYVDLRSCWLPGLRLKGARLRNARFEESDLRGADFRDADLTDAHLDHALLGNADFRGATIDYTDFRRADLGQNETLTEDQLHTAVGDDETQLPARLEHMRNKMKENKTSGPVRHP